METLPRTAEQHQTWWLSQADVPYGDCWCGCGAQTNLAPHTSTTRFWVGGCPTRYIRGHQGRRRLLDEAERLAVQLDGPNPDGYCLCGCGEKTTRSRKTDSHHGYVYGQYRKFKTGHSRRIGGNGGVRILQEDRGHDTLCWIWQLYTNPNGYGYITVDGRTQSAHRYFYREYRGAIPANLCLDHLCHVRNCVNPWHLEPVTGEENTRRGSHVKLSLSDAKKIRALHLEHHLGVPELARLFQVNAETIRCVILNKTWKDKTYARAVQENSGETLF